MSIRQGKNNQSTILFEMNTSQISKSNELTEKRKKAHKCYQCDYASVRADSLRIHLRTHLGEKSFKCNQCDYASVHSGNLRKHLSIHTGIKPYKCNQCDYASGLAGNLTTHLKSQIRLIRLIRYHVTRAYC